jgi:hypothetical protein
MSGATSEVPVLRLGRSDEIAWVGHDAATPPPAADLLTLLDDEPAAGVLEALEILRAW